MEYLLTRSKRKTIAISFDGDGNLIVKAPFWLSEGQIEGFIREKEEWIQAVSKRLSKERKEREASSLKLENGDDLPYFGKMQKLTVIHEERKRGAVKHVMDRILLYVPYEAGYSVKKEQLEKWYRKEASRLLLQKAVFYAEKLPVRFETVHIKDQKSRWGSCSAKGNLNFNWRIIMAPEEVCDYVVIHELCHLVYMDHSKNFWHLVETICPEHKACRKWLKEHGKELYPF